MKLKLLFLITLIPLLSFSQQEEPIKIGELTMKLSFQETKEIYYSFAEGDEIIFDFELIKGKNLKEIEIIELPSNSVFMEYKATKLENKKIVVRNKGLYKFRLFNSAIGKRVCKVKISRIPESEKTKKFNTNWKWKILRDTTYVPYTKDSITGYKTIRYKETKRELVKTEKVEDLLFNKNQRVHSQLSDNRNSTYLRVDLPNPIKSELKEEKVISWAYWIGVGQEAQEAYKKSSSSIANLATDITTAFGTPLAGLAVGTITDLIIPKTGEDVGYSFIPDYENAQKYINGVTYLQFDTGKGIVAYGKKTNRNQGTFYIGLYNDNQIQAIDVNVKVVAIKEIKTFENKEYDREKEEPIIVTLNKKRMEVKETKIRVPVE